MLRSLELFDRRRKGKRGRGLLEREQQEREGGRKTAGRRVAPSEFYSGREERGKEETSASHRPATGAYKKKKRGIGLRSPPQFLPRNRGKREV